MGWEVYECALAIETGANLESRLGGKGLYVLHIVVRHYAHHHR
jgi:hypothetical protein